MKTLSLKQPFAELILSGRKTIELRSWNTKFRGQFLIHASLSPKKERMQEFGFEKLPTGYIVGSAELVAVKKYLSEKELALDADKHLAKNWAKKFPFYGFVVNDVKRFDTPIPWKGKLNFFDVDL